MDKYLKLTVLPQCFAVCRLAPVEEIPEIVYSSDFFSITRTNEELSLILPESETAGLEICEKGWRALKVLGPLDFNLVGVLSELSRVLARAGVSIFVLSTYDTDYILVKEKQLQLSINSLHENGFSIIEED